MEQKGKGENHKMTSFEIFIRHQN